MPCKTNCLSCAMTHPHLPIHFSLSASQVNLNFTFRNGISMAWWPSAMCRMIDEELYGHVNSVWRKRARKRLVFFFEDPYWTLKHVHESSPVLYIMRIWPSTLPSHKYQREWTCLVQLPSGPHWRGFRELLGCGQPFAHPNNLEGLLSQSSGRVMKGGD
jgi:hypothetical protein